MTKDYDIEKWKLLCETAARDPAQVAARHELARFTAQTFEEVARDLGALVFGPPPEYKTLDDFVALSMLMYLTAQLTSASNDLFADGRHYAAAALLRQLVEVEYLAWAFDTRDQEAERWLRSTKDERQNFFTPAKLRRAANGTFRSKDYAYHCELGGHPVPRSVLLLVGSEPTAQLLLSDLLGHTGRIWDHFLNWSVTRPLAEPIRKRKEAMFFAYSAWKRIDQMVELPPPP